MATSLVGGHNIDIDISGLSNQQLDTIDDAFDEIVGNSTVTGTDAGIPGAPVFTLGNGDEFALIDDSFTRNSVNLNSNAFRGVDDVVVTGTDDVNVTGNRGANTILGNTGDNKISGKGGNDHITDTGGNNVLKGDGGNDTVEGGDGNDKVYGGPGSDVLFGGGGNDKLWGEGGNDHLDGGAGNDTVSGGGGADTVLGGTGDDRLIGGPGPDVFIVSGSGSGDDTIADFSKKDILLIEDRTGDGQVTPGQDFTITENGNSAVINLTDGDSVTLKGVDANKVTFDDTDQSVDGKNFDGFFTID
jgi:Ca2+-binding RTX toxin-like protein